MAPTGANRMKRERKESVLDKNGAKPGQIDRRKTMTRKFPTIDDYISSYPPDVQIIAEGVRRTIPDAAPAVEETISYQIPTLALDGTYLVHFAAWKSHLALYPAPTGDAAFEREAARYGAAPTSPAGSTGGCRVAGARRRH